LRWRLQRQREAGRSREALGPGLDKTNIAVSELALHEIADGAFTPDELAPFLPGADRESFSSS